MRAATSVLGVQTSGERFEKNRRVGDREELPQVANWRCNLTGLSQRSNLFFVAYSGEIFVYEPHFPSQFLPTKPALVINTAPSRPGLTGTIEKRRPRCINYLVVQDLGIEEAVAVARDDGDAEVYLVAHIIHAVERRAAGEAAEVRPFWQTNVGLSAWGLAIHSHARVIAVSSNTHDVTVYQFGLIAADGEDGDGGNWTRHRDVIQRLPNGVANVPYVSFCNTGDDPEARWLLTTDISGLTRAIDLFTPEVQPFAALHYDPDTAFDRRRAGWTAIFLDRRSFFQEEDMDSALGPGYVANHQVWDISCTAVQLSGSALTSILPDDGLDGEDLDGEGLDGDGQDDEDSDIETRSVSELSDTSITHSDPSTRTILKDYVTRLVNLLDLPCPMLHSSVKDVYLHQPSPNGPTVGFTDALHQRTQAELAGLNIIQRLNMIAYIPSIGVVILASQNGYAVVLSLTKVQDNQCTTYAMRIDQLLPLPYQEERRERPTVPLLGIAVGPIQGTELLREDQKRWRLFMTYYDHTILSYEITRRRETDSAAALESVVI